MLRNKTIDRICCAGLAVMLILTAVVWVGKSSAGRQDSIEMGYEGLFDQSVVHTIDIEIDNWDSLIADAGQETYTACSVTIDGEKISNVGIRGKGNTSLSSVSTMGSQKYSFKIEFDQYVTGKTYHGLDKLSLNNLIYDATMMKDYLAYTLMNRAGVPAPLCSFAQITVNGEAWGLYLAVEGVEDGFMERNNMTTGELYKPDSLSFGGGRGNGMDFDFEQFRVDDDETGSSDTESMETADVARESGSAGSSFNPFSGQVPEGMSLPEGMSAPDGFQMPEGMSLPEGMSPPDGFQMPDGMSFPGSPESSGTDSDGKDGFTFSFGGGMFNFGMGNSDVKLQYTDDDPDSYANIFDNAKTKIGKQDKVRLISALKTLNSENAQDAVFTDEVISYLAVHDFLQNDDSYTGMMVHNYYLYEEDGKLAIIPWDYNLAFGGMSGGSDASSTVNSPIDSPVSTSSTGDRPLISWIMEDEEALEKYHEVYSEFIAENIESGWLESEITRVSEMIRSYVETDEHSFYTVEEFDAAIEALQSYCALRGESIRGQLEGTIPSTSEGQRADSSALVDTGDLSLSVMGAMNTGGGGFGGGPGGGGMPSGNPFGSSGDGMPSGNPFGSSGDGMPSGNPFGSSGDGMPSGNPFGSSGDGIPSGNPFGSLGDGMPSGNPSANSGEVSETENSSAETEETVHASGEGETDGSPSVSAEENPSGTSGTEEKPSSGSRQRPGGEFFPGAEMNGSRKQTDWVTFGICIGLLLAAIFAVSRAKGHNG